MAVVQGRHFFGLAALALTALGVSTMAILPPAAGQGPFANHDLLANMVTIQMFNAAAALTSLVPAAAVTGRSLEIRHLCGEVSDTVFALRPGTVGD